jgi:hypothetical protein
MSSDLRQVALQRVALEQVVPVQEDLGELDLELDRRLVKTRLLVKARHLVNNRLLAKVLRWAVEAELKARHSDSPQHLDSPRRSAEEHRTLHSGNPQRLGRAQLWEEDHKVLRSVSHRRSAEQEQ